MTNTTKFPREIGILPLRSGVLLPGTTLSMPVGRKRSVALVERLETGTIVGIAVQRDPDDDDPARADLHDIGTYARINRIQRVRDGSNYRVVLEGLGRFTIGDIVQSDPYMKAKV